MRKFLPVFFAGFLGCTAAASAGTLADDTSDPLYMLGMERVLSQTTLTFWDSILRAGQTLSYGLNDRLNVSANIHFQEDFGDDNDGFSSFDLGAVYRMATASASNHIISDVLFGIKVGGSSHVRTPDYADSTYYAGLRFGRQMAGVTVAGTIKSSWIFDGYRGMSFIDMTPEVYFRLNPDWRFGANFTWRAATHPDYDQEWVGMKLIREYGRTQYVGHVDYEFESDNVQVGAKVNILF